MGLSLLNTRGCDLDKQRFTWRELVQNPISKLDDDAFTRVRIILMTGLESEALRFGHMAARFNADLRLPLARVRRAEQHQATMIAWLLGADHSPLETTIGYEQAAIEVTASVARHEPDPYLAQVYRFGLLEHVDHLYRFAALLDRLEGKDANNILQSYTDIVPGRATAVQHRAPEDDVRRHYDSDKARFQSKLHALTLMGAEYQAHDYYMTIGPLFSDPMARQLYAEIASIGEQHVTQYSTLPDPAESWLEQWVLHEANEVYNYNNCVEQETNIQLKAIWERFLDYELGHFNLACELFQEIEQRDPAEIIPTGLPQPIELHSHREFVRDTLLAEAGLRAHGTGIASLPNDSPASIAYRKHMNADGSPSGLVAAGYIWRPGTELNRKMTVTH